MKPRCAWKLRAGREREGDREIEKEQEGGAVRKMIFGLDIRSGKEEAYVPGPTEDTSPLHVTQAVLGAGAKAGERCVRVYGHMITLGRRRMNLWAIALSDSHGEGGSALGGVVARIMCQCFLHGRSKALDLGEKCSPLMARSLC